MEMENSRLKYFEINLKEALHNNINNNNSMTLINTATSINKKVK